MLTRQKIILGLLAKSNRPIAKTSLVKLAFLMRNETFLNADSTYYDFVPYRFGPFSSALYRELSALEANGYISPTDDKIKLHSSTVSLTLEKVNELRCEVKVAISDVHSKYGRLQQETLVKDVYARYPWFATRSELSHLVPSKVHYTKKAAIAIYTVGYEGVSIDHFFNHLLLSGIMSIIDVRSNPVSRKYGFAKKSLSEIAKKLGFTYHHLPELGISSAARKELNSYDSYQRLLDEYEKKLSSIRPDLMKTLLSLIKSSPSALLCMERDVRCCHRSRLAIAASSASKLPIIHL